MRFKRGDKVEYRYGGYVLIGTVVEYRQIGSYGRYFIDGFKRSPVEVSADAVIGVFEGVNK